MHACTMLLSSQGSKAQVKLLKQGHVEKYLESLTKLLTKVFLQFLGVLINCGNKLLQKMLLQERFYQCEKELFVSLQ